MQFFHEEEGLLLLGLFDKGKLNGPLISFTSSKEIEFVAQYRKGKFKKYLCHRSAKEKSALKKLNKKARDPMKPVLVIM